MTNKIEFKATEHEAPENKASWLKETVLEDKPFHYQMTDKDRQMVDYYIRYNNKKEAQETLKELIFLMDLWKDEEVPEWYTREDLKKDIERVKAL
ncbi:hypothetical protein [Limosilactobacillus reuteri]|uniref:hypothetical protein n=1 Tax=Limosilactobacillus reuteri TaxID=1598 RepID=UPI00266FE9F4|nr:hypothetical protein [Limosilactobacillus reuteri]